MVAGVVVVVAAAAATVTCCCCRSSRTGLRRRIYNTSKTRDSGTVPVALTDCHVPAAFALAR